MTPLQTTVAVIGAGAAGLAAARRLRERGIDAVVLEARDRIGGRAHTVIAPDGTTPVELGAEFIHGTPAVTFDLLRETGAHAIDEVWESAELRDGRLQPGEDVFKDTREILDRVDANAPDQSVEAFLRAIPPGTASERELQRVRRLVEGFDAAITTDASVRAIAEEWRSETNGSQFRPSNGYAPLMEHLANTSRDRILLQTRVDTIDWRPGDVRIRATRDGEPFEVRAQRAIVTLPTGVLAAGSVRFTPELPQKKRDAIAAIATGPVVKVALYFRSAFWEHVDGGRFAGVAFFQAPESPFPTLWTQLPHRTPLLVAWAGGGAVQRLQASHGDMVAAALDTCETLFPSVDVRAELVTAYYHDWQTDPYARGAYSYLRVNAGNAREVLATPVEDTLYFAGEATSNDEEGGTVAGAIESGHRTANEMSS